MSKLKAVAAWEENARKRARPAGRVKKRQRHVEGVSKRDVNKLTCQGQEVNECT